MASAPQFIYHRLSSHGDHVKIYQKLADSAAVSFTNPVYQGPKTLSPGGSDVELGELGARRGGSAANGQSSELTPSPDDIDLVRHLEIQTLSL